MTDERKPTEETAVNRQSEDPGEGGTPEDRPASARRRLLRPRDDRMIAGVAAGLGDYFNVDPVIFRIGFAVSIFFGGLGLLAYLALALVVPSAAADGEPAEAPIQRSPVVGIAAVVVLAAVVAPWFLWGVDSGPDSGSRGWFFGPPLFLIAIAIGAYLLLRNAGGHSIGGVIGAIVLALVALAVLGVLATASAWAGATGNGVVVGGVIAAIGVLLALAAFRGGARWLIVPAAVLALPLGAVAAADISFDEGVGHREHIPTSVATIPDEGYEFGIGRMAIDLRELDWRRSTTLELEADHGIGALVIAVPEHVCFTALAAADLGEVELAGRRADGIHAELAADVRPARGPRLDIEADVDVGALRVINDDDVEIDRHGPWRAHDELPNDDELRLRHETACAQGAKVTRPEGE